MLDGLFRLSVMPSSSNEISCSSLSIANVKYCDIWYGRLDHVNRNCHNGFSLDLDDHKNKKESPPIFFV